MATTRTRTRSTTTEELVPSPRQAPGLVTGTDLDAAVHPGTAASTSEGDDLDYVTFSLAGELFAVPMARVNEIIRMPSLVKVPLSPPSLLGLANLRGQILPVVDLRRCCAIDPVEATEATRVIVLNSAVPLGVVVDRVAAVLSVEASAVQDVGTVRSTIDSDLLAAVLRPAETSQMVAVLDVLRLIDEQFPTLAATVVTGAPDLAGDQLLTAEARDDSGGSADSGDIELVSFVVDGQEYALPIHQVQEIVQSPEAISHVPNSDPRVMGVMDLRGALLPVVSLRRIFNLPQAALDSSNRVVVVPLQEEGTGRRAAVGVVMDTVREVLRVPSDLVDGLPAFLATSGELAEVESICRLEGGARVVSVLSAQRLFAGNGLRAAIDSQLDEKVDAGDPEDEETQVQATTGRSLPGTQQQLVVFGVDDEEYCVNVDAVQEIIRVPEQLIKVPKALAFVEGLVNLRGSVLPVVNLRTRLGLPRRERDERQRIVVLIVAGVRTGFVVDSVIEVMKLEDSVVEPAPQLTTEQSGLITQVANLTASERMLLILEPEELLGREQVKALKDSAPEAAAAS